MSQISYRPEIDGLRAIAILSVLIFHIDATYLSGGFVGVDIFFVISGFLITSIIKKEIETTGKFSFKNFYIRRAKRLLPALFVVFIVTAIVATFLLSPTHLSSYGGSLVSAILSLSNIFFWIEADYFDVSAKVKPLLHTWSLSIEEQFYFLWPLTLLILLRLKDKRYIFAIFLILIVLSLYINDRFDDGSISFINHYLPSMKEYFSDGKSTIFFLLPFRIYEFIVGASMVWLMHYSLKKQYFYDILFVLGLSLIGYSIFFFDESLLFPSYYGLIPTVGTALLIYTSYYSRLKVLLSNKLFVSIGLISYSLYLVHWTIIVFWNYISQNISFAEKVFIFTLSVFLAYLSFKHIEQPFRKKEYNFSNFKKTSFVLLLSTLIVGGHSMFSNNGWEWRVDSVVNFENTGDSKNFHKKFYGGEGYPYSGAVHTEKPADIVVIGDSHARHYMEGLYSVIAKPNNLNLYNSSGTSCIMLPDFTRTTKGTDWNYLCQKGLNNGLKYLKEGSKDAILIISESWLTQMTVADLIDSDAKMKGVKVSIKDIIKGIHNLKSLIGDRQLIVIGNVPGAEHNLYDIFTRPQPIFFSDFSIDKYIKSAPKQNILDFNRTLKEESLKTDKFVFLDPHDVLCENDKCRNLDSERHLIYSDANHLSKYGSIEVIKGFLPIFEKFLNKELKYE